MRGSLRASDTAIRLAGVLGCVLLFATIVLACAHAAPKPAPPRQPPPHVLIVAFEQVALRTSAWVELHASLARADAYKGARADDDRDELLGRTAAALAACDDEKCARAAVTGTPFANAYLAALPDFLGREWTERAARARSGVEVARASIGPEVEPLVVKLAHDLAIDWPASPPIVDVVSDAPEPGREAPIRVFLAARGTCFYGERNEPERMHDARVIDCVLSYAALRLDARSELATALRRELTTRGKASETTRAWTCLVVHAVAATISAWEPKHASPLRRSAAAVLPRAMEWLTREWPARLRGEPVADFAKRYADALLTVDSDP